MTKATLILLAVAAVFTIQAGAVIVRDCVTGAIDSKSVQLSGCTSSPCKLKRGSTQKLTFAFTPTSTVRSLTARITVKVPGGAIRPLVPLDGTDACEDIHKAHSGRAVSCPLKRHERYVYQKEGPVNTSFPVGKYSVRWALQQRGSDVACFELSNVQLV